MSNDKMAATIMNYFFANLFRQNRDSACLSHFKQFDRRKKSWNTAKSAGKQFSSKKSHSTNFLDESDKDDTIVVFLIGGITFSEIRY